MKLATSSFYYKPRSRSPERMEAAAGEDHGLKAPFPPLSQSYQGDGHQPLKPGMAFGYHLYPHPDGFVYLAAILDAYSRKVIGYAVSTRLDTALTLEALRMAIVRRQPGPPVLSITRTRECSTPQVTT